MSENTDEKVTKKDVISLSQWKALRDLALEAASSEARDRTGVVGEFIEIDSNASIERERKLVNLANYASRKIHEKLNKLIEVFE